MLQNAVRSLKTLHDHRCFSDTDTLDSSERTVGCQGLKVAAPVMTGAGPIATQEGAW